MNPASLASKVFPSSEVFSSILHNPLVAAIGWALLHSLWIVGLMALALFVLLRMTRKTSSQVRYAISCIALFTMPLVLIVAVGLCLNSERATPEIEQTVVLQSNLPRPTIETATPAYPDEFIAIEPSVALATNVPAEAKTAESQLPSETAKSKVIRFVESRLPWIVVAWLAGVFLFSIRPLVGWLAVERLRRSGIQNVSENARLVLKRTAQKLNLNKAVQLVESALVQTPVVVGWLRPMILLPVSAVTGLTEKELAALFAHELAHVRRNDYLVNLLQTIVETIMFYHPCVWWVSRVIREERENCCDDMAIQVCNHSDYVQALLSMERLRDQSPALAMSAKGGTLVKRIRRIAGLSDADGQHRSTGGITFLVTLCIGMLFLFLAVTNVNAADDNDDAWGEVSQGLRLRAVPVLAEMFEDEISLDQPNEVFENFEDLAFAIEIENVTDEPIKFLDTRYGPSYGESAGKANSDWMGQFLFSIKYYDSAGELVAQPAVELLSMDMAQEGSAVSEIAPKAKHQFLIRPSKMLAVFQPRLGKGEYTAVVCYHGSDKTAAKRIAERSPESPFLSTWSGEVLSPKVAINLDLNTTTPEPVWGQPVDGIQTALEMETGQKAFQSSDKPKISLLVKNTNEHAVVFSGFIWLSDEIVEVTDAQGESVKVEQAWYTGWTLSGRVTLEPGQVCKFDAGNIGIAIDEDDADFEHVTNRKLIAAPGQYKLRMRYSFAPSGLKDGKGELVSPNDKDWAGELTTGWLPIQIEEQIEEPRQTSGVLRFNEDSNEFEITGIARCNDGSKTPIQVSVKFFKLNPEHPFEIFLSKQLSEPLSETTVMTDADGYYLIKIPEKLGRDPLFRLGVNLDLPGCFTREITPFRLGALDTNELISKKPDTLYPPRTVSNVFHAIELTELVKSRSFKGVVRLANGKPAAGAKVFLQSNPGQYHWKFPDKYYYDWVFETTADELGRFEAVTDYRAVMAIQCEGHAPLLYGDILSSPVAVSNSLPDGTEIIELPSEVDHKDAEPIEFVIPTGVRPTAVVLDAQGEPIPFAIVSLVKWRKQYSSHPTMRFSKFLQADAQGNVVFGEIPKGLYRIRAAVNFEESKLHSYPFKVKVDAKPIPEEHKDNLFLFEEHEFTLDDPNPKLRLQAIESKKVSFDVEIPEQTNDTRFVGVSGSFQDKDWKVSVAFDKNGTYSARVPAGLSEAQIYTDLAWLSSEEEQPFEIGSAFRFDRIDEDITGLRIRYEQKSKVRVVARFKGEMMDRPAGPQFVVTYSRKGIPELHVDSTQPNLKEKITHAFSHRMTADNSMSGELEVIPNQELTLQVFRDKIRKELVHESVISVESGETKTVVVDLPDD